MGMIKEKVVHSNQVSHVDDTLHSTTPQ